MFSVKYNNSERRRRIVEKSKRALRGCVSLCEERGLDFELCESRICNVPFVVAFVRTERDYRRNGNSRYNSIVERGGACSGENE